MLKKWILQPLLLHCCYCLWSVLRGAPKGTVNSEGRDVSIWWTVWEHTDLHCQPQVHHYGPAVWRVWHAHPWMVCLDWVLLICLPGAHLFVYSHKSSQPACHSLVVIFLFVPFFRILFSSSFLSVFQMVCSIFKMKSAGVDNCPSVFFFSPVITIFF